MMQKILFLLVLVFVSDVKLLSFHDGHKMQLYMAPRTSPTVIERYSERVLNEEFIRHVHSLSDTYEDEIGRRVMVETNSLINTKYRAWKRNADQINTILALPKAMSEAGR